MGSLDLAGKFKLAEWLLGVSTKCKHLMQAQALLEPSAFLIKNNCIVETWSTYNNIGAHCTSTSKGKLTRKNDTPKSSI